MLLFEVSPEAIVREMRTSQFKKPWVIITFRYMLFRQHLLNYLSSKAFHTPFIKIIILFCLTAYLYRSHLLYYAGFGGTWHKKFVLCFSVFFTEKTWTSAFPGQPNTISGPAWGQCLCQCFPISYWNQDGFLSVLCSVHSPQNLDSVVNHLQCHLEYPWPLLGNFKNFAQHRSEDAELFRSLCILPSPSSSGSGDLSPQHCH